MGYYNQKEIEACEVARRELKRLAKIVDLTQAECPHTDVSLTTQIVHKTSSKWHGCLVRVCRRCSKIILEAAYQKALAGRTNGLGTGYGEGNSDAEHDQKGE